MILSKLNNIIVIGAGGHSRSVISLLESNSYSIAGVIEEGGQPANEKVSGYSFLGGYENITHESNIILAIGDNIKRSEAYTKFQKNVIINTIIHPTSLIEKRVKTGVSNLIFARCFLNSEVAIGSNCIINTGCLIEHESVIGNHCHISVGSIIAGRVNIGDYCFIGAGAVIKDKIKITSNVTIGAGSTVIKDITEPGTYVGSPAKKIK